MSGQSLRRRLLPFALLVPVIAGAACNLQISTDVEAKDQWTRSYPISANGSLSIVTGNGKVVVETADIKTIEVWAERIVKAGTEEAANEQLKAIDMHEDVSADRVSIDGSTKGLNIRTSRRINYVVKVPKTVAVTLESSNGDISVTGLTGAFRASASNGRIIGTDLAGSAHVSTTNGVIELTMAAVTGDVAAETTNVRSRSPSRATPTRACRHASPTAKFPTTIWTSRSPKHRVGGSMAGSAPVVPRFASRPPMAPSGLLGASAVTGRRVSFFGLGDSKKRHPTS
jgi:hypothetical protein